MATLTAKNLAKAYKGRRVVEDVSLTVNSGEIVGLLGPNGAGKTTTFYMVVGIVPRDAGNIIIDDEDISLLPLHARARRGIGYLLGATFGAITPFCSCSSIPLFLGFTMARIPLGITMAFLITSPLINEIAVVLLWGLLGWKFTVVYVVVGMAAGMLGGWLLDLLRAERWLQPFLRGMLGVSGQAARDERNTRLGLEERHRFAWDEMTGIFRRVWRWVIIGVGLGALLHGFVPQDWFAAHLGQGQWWSVPVAVLVGIPLYSNVTGVVPIMESLLLKGLPVGTTLAFCMSTVAASLPEMLMLKQVMRWQLLALFLGLLLVIFTLAGWLFNSLQLTLF